MTACTAQIDAASEALGRMAAARVEVTRDHPRRVRVRQADVNRLMARHESRLAARSAQWDREESGFREMVASVNGPAAWDRFAGLLGERRTLGELMRAGPTAFARYDSAQTVYENQAHWSMADNLSADAAASPAVRSILRCRSRYEVANNCYAGGVGLTIANDFAGTGPRLNLSTESESVNSSVESLFAAWAKAVNLPSILRVMRQARRQDGEAFCLLVSNPGVENEVKLGLRCVEADQIQSFDLGLDESRVDGIRFDAYCNPVAYDILRSHPGSAGAVNAWRYDIWPRRYVLHWFRPSRPGQHRGIPEIVAALPLYATLRRYTQATLDAAETAADMAILLHTQAGAEFEDEDGQPQSAEASTPFSTVPFQRRMFVALPQGYDASQFEAKQPTQQYSNFKREIAGEIGRCENVSRNVVLLDSSESNFASGQLDHKVTYRTHDIDRSDADGEILDRAFRAWLDEARLIDGYLPAAVRASQAAPPHTWYWDSNELGDLVKIANAKAKNLSSGLTSLPAEYAARGQDWVKALETAARGYGITVPELQALIRQNVFAVTTATSNGTGQGGGAADGRQDDEEPPVPPKAGRQGDEA